MRRLLMISVIVLSIVCFLNIFSLVQAEDEKVFFQDGFESGSHEWKHTEGLLLFPKTEKREVYEGNRSFRLTGFGFFHSGLAGRFERFFDYADYIPVTDNVTFEFAYYFPMKRVSYVGYQIGFNDGKTGDYISFFNGEFVNISSVYLVQYTMEEPKIWYSHRSRIYSDYQRAFGNVPIGLKITYVALIMGDPYRANKFIRPIQTAFFDGIKFYEDSTNFPPYPPACASGVTMGRVNTTYEYTIQASDPNKNRVRIYCEYDNNTGMWSKEWIKSGESTTFPIQWNTKGNHIIRSYAQDEFFMNGSWSDSLNVFIANDTYPLMVLDPNGNEQLTLGGNYIIAWSSNNETGEQVKIELFKDDENFTIVKSTQNSGHYLWQIPYTLIPGMEYKIRISSVRNPTIHDFSDASFALEKPSDFDLLLDPKDIVASDWTPKIHETINITAMITRYKGSQPVNATIDFYLKELDEPAFEPFLINTSHIFITQSSTSWTTQWTPAAIKHYQLSVQIHNDDDKEEASIFNNDATAIQTIRVNATDDDLLIIPPKGMTRVSDGGKVLINFTVICGDHSLNNVYVEVFDPKDFVCHCSTSPQDLSPNAIHQYWIEVTAARLPANLSLVQNNIIVRAMGFSGGEGTPWTSNMGYAALEVYRPQSILAEVTVLSVLVSGFVAIFSLFITETGKYKLFSFLTLLVPLFTHIRAEEVLENFVRGQIYGYIKTNPGSHYNNIRKALEIGNGTLAHHLSMLEKTGLIKSRQEGLRYRLFYPTEMTFPEIRKYMLSKLQLGLLKIISSKPGISQTEIVRMQNESQQTISYNLKELEKVREVVSLKKHGRRYYFIPPDFQTNY